MIGDAGYGLFILLVCLWVIRRIEKGKRNLNIMPKQLRSFALLILKKRQMLKLAKAMIPGCIVAIILGIIFDLYFGFHLNGYALEGWVPKSKINQIETTLKKHTAGTTVYKVLLELQEE